MTPNDKATDLQDKVRASEIDQLDLGNAHYGQDRVRQAVVHTREDMVLVVSYLKDTVRLLRSIRTLLVVIAIAVVVVAVVLVNRIS